MSKQKEATMVVLLSREDKIRFVWQAKAEGKKLEEWVTEHLRNVCDKAGTPKADGK